MRSEDTITQSEIQRIIREFVVRELIPGDAGNDLKDNDSLFKLEVIDSVSILQLLAFVDSEFDVRIESQDVNAENFDSIERLGAYVRSKLNSSVQRPGVAA